MVCFSGVGNRNRIEEPWINKRYVVLRSCANARRPALGAQKPWWVNGNAARANGRYKPKCASSGKGEVALSLYSTRQCETARTRWRNAQTVERCACRTKLNQQTCKRQPQLNQYQQTSNDAERDNATERVKVVQTRE